MGRIIEVIENLFLCDYETLISLNKDKIKNFDEIVSLAKECDHSLKTAYFPLEDGLKFNTKKENEELFLNAIRYIFNNWEKNKKVLIHCYAGISRTSAVTIGVIMLVTGFNYGKTISFMRKKYPIGFPNLIFIDILSKGFKFKMKGL